MVTLEQVQTYLWLTVQVDAKMDAILDWVNAKVKNNVGNLDLWEKTMEVDTKVIKKNTFTLNIINPTDLTEINWNDVSWLIPWTDYYIKTDWDVIINNLYDYLATDNVQNFGLFNVKFNAWYAIAPKTLVAIVSEYVGYLYSQDLWKDTIQEHLWPRWVEYNENNINWQNIALKKFKKWLNQFIPLALKIY